MSELVSHYPITSQQEFVDLLAARGFAVTQATVSRDIAELGLVKVARADRHVYAVPHDLGPTIRAASDERLRRILADYPVQVRRSGLILLLLSVPGSAAAISQAIDDSTFDEQEGTLAGDDTVLVLFADEGRLERWRARFETLRVGDPREADAVPGGGYGSGAGAVPGGRYGSGAGAVPGGGAVRGGAVRRSGTGG
jgi:transcriptional regulator of arginine metabolism